MIVLHLVITHKLKMTEIKGILCKYLPENSVDLISDLILKNNVQVNITKIRRTKLGDYRPPQNGYIYHRISINHNLNKYDFLITLIHELAHLITWNSYKNKVEPHGNEWYNNYLELIEKFNSNEIFPEDIRIIFKDLQKHPQNSKTELTRTLRKYDDNQSYLLVEEIPFHLNFNTFDGRTFQKVEKLKKRFKCICLNDRRTYLFHPLTRVKKGL